MTGNGDGKMAREPDSMIAIEGVTRRFGAKRGAGRRVPDGAPGRRPGPRR